MNENFTLKCRKCGKETARDSKYCNSCGARIYDIEKLLEPGNFSVKLAIYSALITFVFIILFSFFTAYFYALYDREIISNPERLLIISIVGPVAGIFISTLFTTYIFNTISIKETLAGAALIITLFKISDFILASTFSIEGVGVMIVSFLIAFAGAWLGYFTKKSIKFKI